MLEQPAFGQRLRMLRLERGLSQAALAKGVMSTGYLSRLESGARPPTERVVAKLAERLGLPVSAFDEQRRPADSLARVLAAVTAAEQGEDLAEPLAEALQAGGRLDPALRWQGLWLLARMRNNQARYPEERHLLAELVELSDAIGSAELRSRARVQLARCLRVLGEGAAAVDFAAEAHRLSGALSTADRAAALNTLIAAETEIGRFAEARAHADQLCALSAPLGGPVLVEALWVAATVRIRQGDHAGSKDALEQALAHLDSHEDLMLWTRLRLAAASLYLQVDPPATALARLRLDEAAAVVELIGTQLHQQQVLSLRAQLAFADGRVDDADALMARLAGCEPLLSFRDRVRFDALRGQLLIIRGRLHEGTQLLQELGRQAQESLNIDLAAHVWRTLATALAAANGSALDRDPA
ncbi:helix-turn-helix domain-containing protein [Actinokineospora sp. NPDC004072]